MDGFEMAAEFLNSRIGIDCSDHFIGKIRPFSTEATIKRSETLIYIGDKIESVYFVVKGLLRDYYLDSDGNDVTRHFEQEGSICGGDALLINGQSAVCTEALEDCLLLRCRYGDFAKLIEEDALFHQMWVKALETSLAYKIKRENSFLLKSATERYLDFKREHAMLEKRVNQKYIASYLGITPVSLSRIRRAIKEL